MTGPEFEPRVADPPSDQLTDEVSEEELLAALRARGAAEDRRSMVARGRQIGGVPGAVMAGIMVALRDIYELPRDSGAVVVDAPSEPHDVDRDGLAFAAADVAGEADVAVPALERRPPVTARRRPRWRPRR